MHAGHDDDDHETLYCYRHPSVETALQCLECERPICVDCANHGPVGIKCPECSRTSRAARGVVPAGRVTRGLVAGAVVAAIFGTILYVVNVAFFGIILAFVAGAATGTVVRRASGGYRDPVLARGAAFVAAIGIGGLPVVDALSSGVPGQHLFWGAIASAAAAYGAFTRAS